MAKDNINPPFANGFWIWDDNINGLAFIRYILSDFKKSIHNFS